MFRKYEKTFRMATPKCNIHGKWNLSKKEVCQLLTGTVEISEKVDGANVAIIRGKKNKWTLQRRRGLADTHSHSQYSFFWNWARHNEERILKIPEKWIVYGELMYAKHHIYYDKLPSYFLVFDIWNGNEYLKHEHRVDWLNEIGFCSVPVLCYGHFSSSAEDLDRFIGSKSIYSSNEMAEGIVVKNYRKQMKGKVVRPEFVKGIDEDDHWIKHAMTRNKLTKWAEVYD